MTEHDFSRSNDIIARFIVEVRAHMKKRCLEHGFDFNLPSCAADITVKVTSGAFLESNVNPRNQVQTVAIFSQIGITKLPNHFSRHIRAGISLQKDWTIIQS